MKMRLNSLALVCVLAGSALLVACGGDSGGGGAVLTVKGTAATGAPLVGAVSVTCKSGNGSATSNADGSFTVLVVNGVGPCLLALTPTGGTTLYSVTSGNATTQVSNITPMTNLLVSYLSNVPGMVAADPVAWFALGTTQALLADTTALNTRIAADFIPAVKTLVPTLSLTDSSFLSTAFVADPGVSSTDADLVKLAVAGVVTDTGAPSPAAITALDTAASNDAVVVLPTGGAGTGG